jgi:hypothetical protein
METSTKIIGTETSTPQTQISVGDGQVGAGGGVFPEVVVRGAPLVGVGLAFVVVVVVGFSGVFELTLMTLVVVNSELTPLTITTTEPEV